eukprot:gene7991-12456_t
MKVELTGFEQLKDHTEYCINVHDEKNNIKWTVKRRYKEFLELHQQCCKIVGEKNLPKFPGKTLFNKSSDLIEKRKGQLQAYLEEAIKIEFILNSAEMNDFLDNTFDE